MAERKGFTHIELLAVVSVIALSTAVLMPTLSKNRQSARLAACRNNQKILAFGLNAQASENNGRYFERNGITFPNEVGVDSDTPAKTPDMVTAIYTYVAGEKGQILFCPLQSKYSRSVSANPGIDSRRYGDWSGYTQREKDLAKYFYVSRISYGYSSYWIGYNMYAGLTGTTDIMWRLIWRYSNNSTTSGPPMTPGSSKDVILSDFAHTLKNYGWASSHDQTAASGQWSHPNYDQTIDPQTGRPRGIPFPDKDPGMNMAYSDGHVEHHKKATSYIQAGSSGWYFFW